MTRPVPNLVLFVLVALYDLAYGIIGGLEIICNPI